MPALLKCLVVCLLLIVVGCASQIPNTPAGAVSPSAAALGSGWQVAGAEEVAGFLRVKETRKAGVADTSIQVFSDPGRRMFLLVCVMTFRSVDEAKRAMTVAAFRHMGRAMLDHGMGIETLELPNVGQEAVLDKVTEERQGWVTLVLTFQKSNVIVSVLLGGPKGAIGREEIVGLGGMIEGRIMEAP